MGFANAALQHPHAVGVAALMVLVAGAVAPAPIPVDIRPKFTSPHVPETPSFGR